MHQCDASFCALIGWSIWLPMVTWQCRGSMTVTRTAWCRWRGGTHIPRPPRRTPRPPRTATGPGTLRDPHCLRSRVYFRNWSHTNCRSTRNSPRWRCTGWCRWPSSEFPGGRLIDWHLVSCPSLWRCSPGRWSRYTWWAAWRSWRSGSPPPAGSAPAAPRHWAGRS